MTSVPTAIGSRRLDELCYGWTVGRHVWTTSHREVNHGDRSAPRTDQARIRCEL